MTPMLLTPTLAKPKYIITRIAEPFPVLYGHASQKARKCGEAEGPHYAPGSEHHALFSKARLSHATWSAEALRRDGYTVTVEVV